MQLQNPSPRQPNRLPRLPQRRAPIEIGHPERIPTDHSDLTTIRDSPSHENSATKIHTRSPLRQRAHIPPRHLVRRNAAREHIRAVSHRPNHQQKRSLMHRRVARGDMAPDDDCQTQAQSERYEPLDASATSERDDHVHDDRGAEEHGEVVHCRRH